MLSQSGTVKGERFSRKLWVEILSAWSFILTLFWNPPRGLIIRLLSHKQEVYASNTGQSPGNLNLEMEHRIRAKATWIRWDLNFHHKISGDNMIHVFLIFMECWGTENNFKSWFSRETCSKPTKKEAKKEYPQLGGNGSLHVARGCGAESSHCWTETVLSF